MKKKIFKKTVLAMMLMSWVVVPFQSAKSAEPITQHLNNTVATTITDQIFKNIDYTGGSGGAIYNSADLTINNSEFLNNKSTGWAGGIFNTSAVTTTIKGSKFLNNQAGAGGAFASGTSTKETIIENVLFEGNQANEIGAVAIFSKGTIKNSIFRNNKSTFYEDKEIANAINDEIDGGGALFLGASSKVGVTSSKSIENSLFENNSSVINGGAIATRRYNVASNVDAKLDIIKTYFKGNKAGTTGGALDNYFYGSNTKDGSVYIAESIFDSNSAANGGAIFNHGELDGANKSASLYITNTQFLNNSATENGGAIYNASALTIDSTVGNVLFDNNRANGVANDIYMAGEYAKLSIIGTNENNSVVFNSGIASEAGKGLITVDTNGSLQLNGDNSAYTGVFTQENGNTLVTNKFFNGTNTINGGTLTFANGGVSTNLEIGDGGKVVFANGSSSEIGKTIVMQTNSQLVFDDSQNIDFYSNIISENGNGDIYKLSAGTVNMYGRYDDYTGKVHIEEGYFNFLGGSNFGGSISAQVNDGETATISNLSKEINMVVGSIAKTGNGSLTITNDVANNATIKFDDVITIGETDVSGNLTSGGNVQVVAPESTFNKEVSILGENSVLNINGIATFNDNVIVNKGTLGLFGDSTLSNLTIGSTLSSMSGAINTLTIKDLTLANDTSLFIDANPQAGTYVKIVVSNSYTAAAGKNFLIGGVNFTSTPLSEVIELATTDIIDVKSATVSGDLNIVGQTTTDTLMGKYAITGAGSTVTARLQSLNPQMYRGQVATVASYANQLVVNSSLFNHVDMVTMQLLADKKANTYAAADPIFAPYQYSAKDGGLWFKSYVNLERISMTNGLSVGNNAYGSLIGADFPLVTLDNGWKLIPTAYVGYNGAHQTFNGVSMYQNGGQAGVMGTLYKNDFITSLLAYAGGYGNSMSVGNATDNTGNWFAGIASKSAYNIHLPADLILQPTAMVAYNLFGSQSYNSNYGNMSMGSGSLNGLNVAPGVNLIWQKDTFSVYGTAQMVFNMMGASNGHAGNVNLSDVEMRHGFFEYGLGVTKKFKDRVSSFAQVTFRNGGRTGVGFQGGIQIKL